MPRRLIWKVALWSFVVFVAVFFVVGDGGGEGQFSPNLLEYRTRSRDWLFGLPIYCGRWRHHQPKLVTYLIDKGYWKAREVAEPRWIGMFQWRSSWRDGESFLHKELSWWGDGWIKWSDKHPDVARELWPCVLAVLRSPGPFRDSSSPKSVAEVLLLDGFDEQSDQGLKSLDDLHRRLKELEVWYGPLPTMRPQIDDW